VPTTFRFVEEVFDRVFRQVLADKGREYMEAQGAGYLGSSREDLALIKTVGPKILKRRVDSVVGPEGGVPVAWLLEGAGLGFVQINDDASESEILALASKFYECDQ
jgi:hypothetical protein